MTFSEARKRAGVSISEVMRHSGLGRSTVFAIQAGIRTPNYGTALKLAKAIGADPKEIVELAPTVRDFEKVGA